MVISAMLHIPYGIVHWILLSNQFSLQFHMYLMKLILKVKLGKLTLGWQMFCYYSLSSMKIIANLRNVLNFFESNCQPKAVA
jgi:hypothetical protein